MAKHAEPKQKSSPLLPIFGAILAFTFAFIAYLLLPEVKDFLSERGVGFAGASPLVRDLLIVGAIWFVLFGTAMFIVSLLIGRHQDDELAIRFNQQAMKRKEAQRRERQLRKLKQQQMRRDTLEENRKKNQS